MVQRPYSEYNNPDQLWKNSSQQTAHDNDVLVFPGPGSKQLKPVIHKLQRPKISTIISSIEGGRNKVGSNRWKSSDNEISKYHNELRQTRNTISNSNNITDVFQTSTERLPFPSQMALQHVLMVNGSYSGDYPLESFYEIPPHSKFFPPVDEQTLQNVEIKTSPKDALSVIIPEIKGDGKNYSNLLVKEIYIGNPNLNARAIDPKPSLTENDKVDFVIEDIPSATSDTSLDSASPLYSYNISANSYKCINLQETAVDIDAQEKYAVFNLEPRWVSKKHFWNHIFDSRYESLMRSPKWPPLRVILIPRTHVDSIWKRSFDSNHNNTVQIIISNIVKKLQFYENLTFSWNEVSHLSHWWKSSTPKSRLVFRKLVNEERLEITTGGWVEPDEATTHLFGLVHQLIEGHQWLKNYLNYTPNIAWLTNTVAHSPTMIYLLSAAGIYKVVFTNLHFSWEEYLAEYQYSDFIWLQNWDNDKTSTTHLNEAMEKIGKERLPKHAVLTHYLQFNSAGFKACGPNKMVCVSDFNFAKANKNIDVYTYNIREKAEILLEQYSKTGTITPHNVIMAPLGGPYHYEVQAEFDYQYNNYQKLSDYINANRGIYKATIEFGTAKDYFKAIIGRHINYPTVKGDFLNFADVNNGSPAYWTGYFTSRPLLKILIRRLEYTLRTTEILFSFAVSGNAFRGYNMSGVFPLLIKSRETMARLLDRNVVSGTLTTNTLKYVHKKILVTVKDCWHVQEVAASLMSIKQGKSTTYLQKYVYRDGEFISVFKTVSPGDQLYVFNSLSHERTEVVELVVRNPNIRIIDHNRKEVTIQINPMWKYNSDNYIKISRRFFKVIFAIMVSPLTFELYKIKETYDAAQNAATIYCHTCLVEDLGSNSIISPFNIQPMQTGDIQLESYKQRLIFDEITGFLKSVIEKTTNIEKPVSIDYGAFRSSDMNSGMFLFSANVTKPIYDILRAYRTGNKPRIIMIISGQVTTEMACIYGRLLQHTVKIYNLLNSPLSNVIYVESKVDYEVSPKNREVEIFLSIQTDIGNGNPPKIFTDNNGFQYTSRIINISRRIESNMYPITTMSFIQDKKSRLTLITDHAQGVTALQEGQLVVMLDRRVLFNDGRGTNEGLADSSATCHKHYILLENFISAPTSQSYEWRKTNLELPSVSAIYLSNSLNYLLDNFVIKKNQSHLSRYAFLPLVKSSFPCDVTLVNYRAIFNKGNIYQISPNTALMTLHRQSFSCQIDQAAHLHCSGDIQLILEKILRNVKAVYQTNLVGTNKGKAISNFNDVNFPPMEILTLRIQF